jgi:hypothetical protein
MNIFVGIYELRCVAKFLNILRGITDYAVNECQLIKLLTVAFRC